MDMAGWIIIKYNASPVPNICPLYGKFSILQPFIPNSVINVPADTLTPNGARPSAAGVMTTKLHVFPTKLFVFVAYQMTPFKMAGEIWQNLMHLESYQIEAETNGLRHSDDILNASNRRQAIIWTNDGLGWWRIYELLGLGELKLLLVRWLYLYFCFGIKAERWPVDSSVA